jgi:hypothetical protein
MRLSSSHWASELGTDTPKSDSSKLLNSGAEQVNSKWEAAAAVEDRRGVELMKVRFVEAARQVVLLPYEVEDMLDMLSH